MVFSIIHQDIYIISFLTLQPVDGFKLIFLPVLYDFFGAYLGILSPKVKAINYKNPVFRIAVKIARRAVSNLWIFRLSGSIDKQDIWTN